MKIYSWNILRWRKEDERIFEFIAQEDFDVLCLQEVSPQLLEKLHRLPYEMASGIDKRSRDASMYLVILSRFPILEQRAYASPLAPSSLRRKLFIFLMQFNHWSPLFETGGLYVDVMVEGRRARVHSAHFTLLGPQARTAEFTAILGHTDVTHPYVIAGDLNIIEHPLLKILNWLTGDTLTSGMPWFPERERFEKLLTGHGLQNPLRGTITHNFAASQLDHILPSKEFEVVDAHVFDDAYGSDHQPVSLTLTIVR